MKDEPVTSGPVMSAVVVGTIWVRRIYEEYFLAKLITHEPPGYLKGLLAALWTWNESFRAGLWDLGWCSLSFSAG